MVEDVSVASCAIEGTILRVYEDTKYSYNLYITVEKEGKTECQLISRQRPPKVMTGIEIGPESMITYINDDQENKDSKDKIIIQDK